MLPFIREHLRIGSTFAPPQKSSEGGTLLGTSFDVHQQGRVRLEVVDEGLERRSELDQHITQTVIGRPRENARLH